MSRRTEHGKVPSTPFALYVDAVVRERAGPDLDVRVDSGVKVEVLALRLATVSLQLFSEADKSASQGPCVP